MQTSTITETPLKDAYTARQKTMNAAERLTDISKISTGDYAMIKTPTAQYFGFIQSVGRVNVVISSPYGGYADNDFICMQDLKFPKNQVNVFCKPNKTN